MQAYAIDFYHVSQEGKTVIVETLDQAKALLWKYYEEEFYDEDTPQDRENARMTISLYNAIDEIGAIYPVTISEASQNLYEILGAYRTELAERVYDEVFEIISSHIRGDKVLHYLEGECLSDKIGNYLDADREVTSWKVYDDEDSSLITLAFVCFDNSFRHFIFNYAEE